MPSYLDYAASMAAGETRALRMAEHASWPAAWAIGRARGDRLGCSAVGWMPDGRIRGSDC